MRIIGITGGVGAGKSTVLDHLREEYDAFVIQADKVGHMVMEPGERCYDAVIDLFGEQIIKADKTIDRKQVSDVVFAEAGKLHKLNGIIHPAVKEYILETLRRELENGRQLAVVEAALFFDDHYEEFCDEVWYIFVKEETRIQRLMKSRGYTVEKAKSIIRSQASDVFFREHTDLVIDNNGDFYQTCLQIKKGLLQ
ncbi:MAG: dephospho-CoA kinase [Blautia sp.]|nr:dephospho-CoA kinase [Blautia sp.]